MRKSIGLAVFLVALPLAARADMSEQDRQARCVNNQARIDDLQAQLASDPDRLSGDDIARERSSLQFVGRVIAETRAHARSEDRWVNADIMDRLWEIDRTFNGSRSGAHCTEAVGGNPSNGTLMYCAGYLKSILAQHIDRAVQADRRAERLRLEIAQRRGRMEQLACASRGATASGPSIGSSTCRADLEGTWSWSWGHGDDVLGRQQTTISRGPATFSRDVRRGQPADGTMSQPGNSGVWKCDGSAVTFEWSASVDTLTVANGNLLQGQGKGDNAAEVNWVKVTR